MLLALGPLAGGAEAADTPSSCAVTRLVGQVTLQREGTTMALSPNVLLYERDQITTGDGSKVEIRCEDGSTIVVVAPPDHVPIEGLGERKGIRMGEALMRLDQPPIR